MDTSTQKTAVISGGLGYVGHAIAVELAEKGFRVGLLARTKKANEDELLGTLPGNGHKIYHCDLTNEDEVENVIANIESEIGPIFAAVHAAGIKPSRHPFLKTPVQEFTEQLEGNAKSGFIFLTSCAKKMKEHKEGVIIGITSTVILDTRETRSLGAYVSAKYALQGTLVCLHEELLSSNVRVYSVAPSFMEEGMNSDIPKAFVEMIRRQNPNKKIITAKEVADKVASLVNDNGTSEHNLTHTVS